MSLETETVAEEVERVVAIVCDKCSIRVEQDDIMRFQEFLTVRYTGGFGSEHWGDGGGFVVHLCEKCHFELFNPLLPTTESAKG